MKKELKLPQVEQSKLKRVCQLIHDINKCYENDLDKTSILKELENICNKTFDSFYFIEYWSWIDLKDFAEMCLLPKPPKIDNLSKEDIIYILDNISSFNEAHLNYYLELLNISTNRNNVSDLIFCSNYSSNEKIAEVILSKLEDNTIYL